MAVFPEIPEVKYEGPDSRNPLAFKHYNPEEVVGGKKMADHLRFAMAFWHTMNAGLTDPFGSATAVRPWSGVSDEMEVARTKMRGIFELTSKLQMPYFCFHDRDIAPEGATLRRDEQEPRRNRQSRSRRTAEGPADPALGNRQPVQNPVHARCGHELQRRRLRLRRRQVKKAIEVTKQLGGGYYVFWGGREGYMNAAQHRHEARARQPRPVHAHGRRLRKEIGFTGQFYFEPKPKEPTKHQYDFDAGTMLGFLRGYDLIDHVKLNLETNHATLAGHTMQHELHVAGSTGTRIGRREPGRPPARMGHRPVPDRPLRLDPRDVRDPEKRRTALRRSELRRTRASPIVHGERPRRGSHHRDGHVREGTEVGAPVAQRRRNGSARRRALRVMGRPESERRSPKERLTSEVSRSMRSTSLRSRISSGHQERFEAILNRAIFG